MTTFLSDCHQQICAKRRPDLHADTVERMGEEASESQVLLDPAPEQLDAPTLAVDLGDEDRIECERVGQEDQEVPAFRMT